MIIINHVACDCCGSCVSVCPGNALILNGKGLVYLEENCIYDLNCVQACPVGALEVIQNEKTI